MSAGSIRKHWACTYNILLPSKTTSMRSMDLIGQVHARSNCPRFGDSDCDGLLVCGKEPDDTTKHRPEHAWTVFCVLRKAFVCVCDGHDGKQLDFGHDDHDALDRKTPSSSSQPPLCHGTAVGFAGHFCARSQPWS